MDQPLKEQLISSMYRLKKIGMTFPQDFEIRMEELILLKGIAQCQDDPHRTVNVSDLQTILQITKPAVSQMLNGLEKKGFVHRAIDPGDRRKVVVTLTDSGKAVLKRSKRYADHTLEQIIARFGEANTRELIRLLNNMAEISAEMKQESLDDTTTGETYHD